MISDKGGRGDSHFLIVSDKRRGGKANFYFLLKREGRGVYKHPFLAGIIPEHPLMGVMCKMVELARGGSSLNIITLLSITTFVVTFMLRMSHCFELKKLF